MSFDEMDCEDNDMQLKQFSGDFLWVNSSFLHRLLQTSAIIRFVTDCSII